MHQVRLHAANVEAAVRGAVDSPPDGAQDAGPHAQGPVGAPVREKVHTPDLPGIVAVSEFLGVERDELIKCIAFDVEGELGLALVPGDREVNPYALGRALAPRVTRVYDEDDFDRLPDVPRGYIGPDLAGASIVVADPAISSAHPEAGWVTGANVDHHHVRHAVLGRDFHVDEWADLAAVATGDACPRCKAPLSVDRGIEVGHTFQLGTKYATALGALYTDEHGDQHPMVMGCYGIGVSRIVAAVAQEHHDENGLCWPADLAPYQAHLVVLPGKGDQAAEVVAAAEALYEALEESGVRVLYDDRDASPGVKFADADLLGMPVRLTLGAKGLAKGTVERKIRKTGVQDDLDLADSAAIAAALGGGS